MHHRSSWWIGLVALGLLLVMAGPCLAATRYVTDRLVVSLRERPHDSAAVVTYLKSDQKLERLEEQGEYTRVRLPAGEVGYVQTQYLTDAPPKAEVIQQLQQHNERLAARVKVLEEQASRSTSQVEQDRQRLAREVEAARDEVAALRQQLEKSQAKLLTVSRDYQTLQENSGNVMALAAQRDLAIEENQVLSERVAILEDERDALLKGGAFKWFLAGAGVLLIGWFIGKLSGTRRRSSLL